MQERQEHRGYLLAFGYPKDQAYTLSGTLRFPRHTVLIRGQAQRAWRSRINQRDGPWKGWQHSRIPENGMRSGASGFGSPRACNFSRDSSSSRMFSPGEIWPQIFHEDHNFYSSCDAPWHACPCLVLPVMKRRLDREGVWSEQALLS